MTGRVCRCDDRRSSSISPRNMTRLPLSALAMSIALLAANAASAQGAASAPAAPASAADDPYIWLEKVDSPEAMDWVRAENKKTLTALEADPRFADVQRPGAGHRADARPHPVRAPDRRRPLELLAGRRPRARHLARRPRAKDYDAGGAPKWRTVLDLDKVSAAEHANWVWEGAQCESRAREPVPADAVRRRRGRRHLARVRPAEGPLRRRAASCCPRASRAPPGRTATRWSSRASGRRASSRRRATPYVVKRLKRGQPLSAAVEVFRGQVSDVSVDVGAAGRRAGPPRPGDPARRDLLRERRPSLLTPSGLRKLALPKKASVVELFDGQLIVKLDEDWTAAGAQFTPGHAGVDRPRPGHRQAGRAASDDRLRARARASPSRRWPAPKTASS